MLPFSIVLGKMTSVLKRYIYLAINRLPLPSLRLVRIMSYREQQKLLREEPDRLRHFSNSDYIVHILDSQYFPQENVLQIILEYIEGGSLRDLLRVSFYRLTLSFLILLLFSQSSQSPFTEEFISETLFRCLLGLFGLISIYISSRQLFL